MAENKKGMPSGTVVKPTGIPAGLSKTDPNEYQRLYRLLRKDRINANRKAWLEANPEMKAKYGAKHKSWRETDEGKQRLKATKLRQRELARDYIESKKSAPCMDCGKPYPSYVMDFHHLRDKSFAVSTAVMRGYTVERIQEEIDKCVLICANCHRIRHHTP